MKNAIMQQFVLVYYLNKQLDSYEKVLQSDIFREATKEERMSVDNYIKEHSVDTGINFNDLIDTE